MALPGRVKDHNLTGGVKARNLDFGSVDLGRLKALQTSSRVKAHNMDNGRVKARELDVVVEDEALGTANKLEEFVQVNLHTSCQIHWKSKQPSIRLRNPSLLPPC